MGMLAKHIFPQVFLLGCLIATGSGASQAQVAAGFLPSDYGKTDLPLRESFGYALPEISKKGDIFEPIGRLPEADPIRRQSRAVVRLDVLTKSGDTESMSVCTASVVAKDVVMTNYHCIPGFSGRVEKASILVDYLEKDAPGSVRLNVSPEPIAADEKLDYALVRVLDPLPADIKPLELRRRSPSSRDRLLIVHHPAGQVKVMTQFQCFVHEKPSSQPEFVRHICDTRGGSSGGVLFQPDMTPIALHHTGGLSPTDPASFNQATALVAIAERHPDLLALAPGEGVAAVPVADTTAVTETTTTPPDDKKIKPRDTGCDGTDLNCFIK
jgi:hypothetical protein